MSSLAIDWGKIFRSEKKGVPQRIKTKVYERAKKRGKLGRCEYSGCGKPLLPSEGHFHHWRDPPTERTTAFLCYECHKKHGHEYKRKTVKTLGIPIDEKTVLVRKRIPIKITSKKAKPKKKAPKKRRKKKITKTPLERYAEKVDKLVYG